MKYLKILITTLFLVITSTMSVNADTCPSSVNYDLNKKASYVKAAYTVDDKSITKKLIYGNSKSSYKIPIFTFKMSIYNIIDDIYVVITNDVDSTSITVNPEDTQDGTYTFENNDAERVYNYTIEIKASNSECYGASLKTIKLTKPKYNAYSEYAYCNNSGSYYCQKFISANLDVNSNQDFFKKIGINPDGTVKDEPKEDYIAKTIKLNRTFYIIVSLVTMLITLIILLIPKIKKYREMKLWRKN